MKRAVKSMTMNFTVKSTKDGLRLGSLSFRDTPEKTFSTPLIVQYTRCGCLPHLTWDVASSQPDIVSLPLLVPVPSSWQRMNETLRLIDQDFRQFCKIKESCPVILSVHDPLIKIRPGFNNKSGIAIWTTAGRSQINGESYTDLMRAMKPSMVQSLCDSDTPKNAAKKRLANSVSRTLEFLTALKPKKETDELRDMPVLASIEGGHDVKSRHHSVEETLKNNVEGFVLEGFHSFGHPTDFDHDEDTKKAVESTVALLPKDRPRMMWGSFPPEVMLQLFKMGIDVLDSSYATALTEEGKALIISSTENGTGFALSTTILDMNSKTFLEDFEPLSSFCSCYGCKKGFSKSYIHHLLNTKEMLASVLLSLHNLQVLQDFVIKLQKYSANHNV